MLHFKYHPLARSQSCQGPANPCAQFASHQVALGACAGAIVGDLVDDAVLFAVGIGDDWSVFFPNLALAKVIEAKVGHDPVDPRIERTLKAEATEIAICLQERVLVDIACILLGPGKVESQAEDSVVVLPDQFLEGGAVAALGSTDQLGVVDAALALP